MAKKRGSSSKKVAAAPLGSIPMGVAQPELLAHIVENAPSPIFLKDREGVYLYVNAAYARAGGIPKEEIVGKKDSDIYPEAVAAAFRSEDLLVMESADPVQSTRPLQVNGEERMFRTVKFPIYSQDGEIGGICGVSLDVTDALSGEAARNAEEERIRSAVPFERLLTSLTPQESRIAELLVQGLSDKQIAETMGLTGDTVRHHVSHVLRKLRRRSRTQVVIDILRYRRRD